MQRVWYLLSCASLLLVGYAAAEPYIAVHQIRQAVQAHDGEEFSEHVDFVSLRQSFKDQLNVMAARETMSGSAGDNGVGMLGAALASVMIDKAVDAYVTPASLSSMLKGGNSSPSASGARSNATDREAFSNSSMAYSSFNKFVVKSYNDNGDEVSVVFRRRGFDWKICEILLPLESMTARTSQGRNRTR